jgi:hypothetical protein
MGEEERRHRLVTAGTTATPCTSPSCSAEEAARRLGASEHPGGDDRALRRAVLTTIQVEATLRMTVSCEASEDVELSGSEFSEILDLMEWARRSGDTAVGSQDVPPVAQRNRRNSEGPGGA